MMISAFSRRVFLGVLLAGCVAASACVHDRFIGDEGGAGAGTGGGPATGDGGAGGGNGCSTEDANGAGGDPVSSAVGGGPATGEGGAGGGTVTMTGGNGTGGGPADCLSCSEFITPGFGDLPICLGESQQLYDALVECVCAGACADPCGDNICVGADVTAECQDCVIDTAAGCGNEFNACSNDVD